MEIITPQRLYHGTTDDCIPFFQKKLLDRQYWRPGRDFGEGFYTTISMDQARRWAYRSAKQGMGSPCVLEIELRSIPAKVEPLVFLSDSLAWAAFILEHRKITEKGEDPCQIHPEIIVGPMADADTSVIVKDAVQLNKDVHWFYEQIIRSHKGRRLDSLRLGNQVVFCTEKLETSLRLTGYYSYARGRWSYHEHKSTLESV